MTVLTAAGAGPRCVESGCTRCRRCSTAGCTWPVFAVLQCCSAAGCASTRPPTGALLLLLLGDAKITSTRDDHNHHQMMHSTGTRESSVQRCTFVCLLYWTPSGRKESGYPIFKDLVSDPELMLMGTTPFQPVTVEKFLLSNYS